MPYFSKKSKNYLVTCHPDLQILFNEVILRYDCRVLCGYRGEKEQNEAFEANYSKVKFPNSYHNKWLSNAVDVIPYPINWEDLDRMKMFIGYVLGTADMLKKTWKIGSTIVSGIDWDRDFELRDTRFFDHPHFQIKT